MNAHQRRVRRRYEERTGYYSGSVTLRLDCGFRRDLKSLERRMLRGTVRVQLGLDAERFTWLRDSFLEDNRRGLADDGRVPYGHSMVEELQAIQRGQLEQRPVLQQYQRIWAAHLANMSIYLPVFRWRTPLA